MKQKRKLLGLFLTLCLILSLLPTAALAQSSETSTIETTTENPSTSKNDNSLLKQSSPQQQYTLTIKGNTGRPIFVSINNSPNVEYLTQTNIPCAEGTDISVTVGVIPGDGYSSKFDHWNITGLNLSDEDKKKNPLTFTMPANNVTVDMEIVNVCTIKLNSASGPSMAFPGDSVEVTANTPPAGKVFDHWDVTGLTLSDEDKKKNPLIFTMPNEAVTLTAVYVDVYKLTVNSGTIQDSGNTTGEFTENTSVTVTADTPSAGKVFDHWETSDLNLSDTDAKTNPFIFSMPASAVTLTAVYTDAPAPPPPPTYTLTVNGGTGGGRYTSFSKVTATADAPPYGFVFDHWDIDAEVTFLEDTTLESPEIKFYMPSHAVTLTVVYRENTVTVEGGTGSGNYDVGEIVTITAEPPKGFTFDHWESETILDFTENTSETDETAKFIMGDRPIEITAIFAEIIEEEEKNRREDGCIGTLYYSIIAEPTNHGTITTDPPRATRGQSITVTVFPDNGYLLDTISITEQNGTALEYTQESEHTYSFIMPKEKVTVSAAFTEDGNLPIPEPTHTPEKTMLPFSDVLETDWYYDAVCSIYESNIMSGTTETTFSPNEPTSRGMLVAILYRMNGEIYPNEKTIFTDVSTDLYYNTAVAWAIDKGIASGIGDNLFAPDTAITREQLAVFLYQYGLYTGMTPSTEGIAIREFTDTDTISPWAAPAVQYCLNSGILSGNPDGTFSPQDNATRAEVASVLMRFLKQ